MGVGVQREGGFGVAQDAGESFGINAAGQRNPSAAMRITKMILNQCSSLKRFPRAGAELSALTGYETELRLLICENYIALYRIDTSTVSVARIIHARQDYMRILLHKKTDEDTHQQK